MTDDGTKTQHKLQDSQLHACVLFVRQRRRYDSDMTDIPGHSLLLAVPDHFSLMCLNLRSQSALLVVVGS